MIRRAALVLAPLFAVAASAGAEATPRLQGVYTMYGIEKCQTMPTTESGHLSVRLMNIKFDPTTSTVTSKGTSVDGSLFAMAADMTAGSKSGTLPYTLTGTANPFKLTLGTNPNAQPYLVDLTAVDASGIAHRAQTLEMDDTITLCTRSLTLQRH